MTEHQNHRVVETYLARHKRVDGEIAAAALGRWVVFTSDTPATDEDLATLAQRSAQLTEKASSGYSREFTQFESVSFEPQVRADGPLFTLMSRIGLGSLVPYDSVETADAEMPVEETADDRVMLARYRVLDSIQ